MDIEGPTLKRNGGSGVEDPQHLNLSPMVSHHGGRLTTPRNWPSE